jgi:formylglycine-generating enzyme required for sulfatase activity
LYNTKITEAQNKISDFKTVWNEFQKLKKQRQSRSTQEQASEETRRRKLESEEEERRRLEESLSTTIDGTRAIFHKVRPDSFSMGYILTAKVVLTAMPDVMATPMTQIIFKIVAELANSRFPEKYQINSDPSRFKGDSRPVESVSWYDAQTWTDALNELLELGEPEVEMLFPGHQKGMRYEPFMTEAQREYLMKFARTEDGDTINGMLYRSDITKLRQYIAVNRSNHRPNSSLEGTIDVVQLKPLYIQDQPFHGLVGNIQEWTRDSWDGRSKLPGGIDPVGTEGRYRVVRGMSYLSSEEFLSGFDHLRYSLFPDDIRDAVGFRLVRTRP